MSLFVFKRTFMIKIVVKRQENYKIIFFQKVVSAGLERPLKSKITFSPIFDRIKLTKAIKAKYN